MKVIAEPRIYLQLSGRGAVGHIVDSRSRIPFEKVDDGAGGIVAVNLINPAPAVSFENGFPCKKLAHEDRTTGSVKTRKSCDESSRIQRNGLSLQQYPTGFSIRSRFTTFIHPGAVGLSVNGCAPGKEHLPWGEGGDCIPDAFHIDQPVRLGGRAVRSSAVYQRVNIAPGKLNMKRAGDV